MAVFYLADLTGVVFNVGPTGNSAETINGVLQAEVPSGLPSDPGTYEDYTVNAEWDVSAAIAGDPAPITLISESYLGDLVYGAVGLFAAPGPSGPYPGTWLQQLDMYLVSAIPSNSVCVPPFQNASIRLIGASVDLHHITFSVSVKAGKLTLQFFHYLTPGLSERTVSIGPYGDVVISPFWTEFKGAIEAP